MCIGYINLLIFAYSIGFLWNTWWWMPGRRKEWSLHVALYDCLFFSGKGWWHASSLLKFLMIFRHLKLRAGNEPKAQDISLICCLFMLPPHVAYLHPFLFLIIPFVSWLTRFKECRTDYINTLKCAYFDLHKNEDWYVDTFLLIIRIFLFIISNTSGIISFLIHTFSWAFHCCWCIFA